LLLRLRGTTAENLASNFGASLDEATEEGVTGRDLLDLTDIDIVDVPEIENFDLTALLLLLGGASTAEELADGLGTDLEDTTKTALLKVGNIASINVLEVAGSDALEVPSDEVFEFTLGEEPTDDELLTALLLLRGTSTTKSTEEFAGTFGGNLEEATETTGVEVGNLVELTGDELVLDVTALLLLRSKDTASTAKDLASDFGTDLEETTDTSFLHFGKLSDVELHSFEITLLWLLLLGSGSTTAEDTAEDLANLANALSDALEETA
jgi:hypothetical protein